MIYKQEVPHSGTDPCVFVYPMRYDTSSVEAGKVAYGLLLAHRELAPEWMRPPIAILDMAADDALTRQGKDNDEVPGVGYKGSIWYAIYEDQRYAIEAGIDLSNLDNP